MAITDPWFTTSLLILCGGFDRYRLVTEWPGYRSRTAAPMPGDLVMYKILYFHIVHLLMICYEVII